MQLKQYGQYFMDFKGKWIGRCAAAMGISLFLRVVYFFGLMNFAECGAMQVVFDMVLTMALCAVFSVFIGAYHRNAPGLYAIMGCGFLLLMAVTTFTSGDALRIVLAVVGYAIAGTVLLGTVAGYIPGRLLSTLTLLIPLCIRLFCYDPGALSLFAWVLEISRLLVLVSLLCFLWSLKPTKKEQ